MVHVVPPTHLENIPTNENDSNQENANAPSLRIRLPRLMMLFKLSRMSGGRKYFHTTDDDILAPISRVVEHPNDTEPRLKPEPPPLPYRLTFKYKKSSKNPWSRHKTVTYELGFNSVNVLVKVEAFESGLRRVFINGEDVVREQANGEEWTFNHFFSDKPPGATPRLGTLLKVVVKPNLAVHLFADGFPVEKLRRSSVYSKGSPPPPGPINDVETLDEGELFRLGLA